MALGGSCHSHPNVKILTTVVRRLQLLEIDSIQLLSNAQTGIQFTTWQRAASHHLSVSIHLPKPVAKFLQCATLYIPTVEETPFRKVVERFCTPRK